MDPFPILASILNPATGMLPYLSNYVVYSLLIGVGATALLYLGSYFLQHPPLNAAAKEELAALILSIAIIGTWSSVGLLLEKTVCALATPSSTCSNGFVNIASGSLKLLETKVRSLYINLYIFEVLLGFLSTVYVPLGTFNPGLALVPISMPPMVSMTLLSNAHTVVVEAIGMIMVALIAKQHLLNFALIAIPAILFPLGIALRAFPWFRTTGSSLISICISIFFIYPISILASNYLIFDVYKPVDFVYTPNLYSLCNPPEGISVEDYIAKKSVQIDNNKKHWAGQENDKENPIGFEISSLPEGLWDKVTSFFSTGTGVLANSWSIFKSIVGIFGDFSFGVMSLLWGVTPAGSAVTGMYYFIVDEVVLTSQFIVLILVTSVFELILTITMYRNVSSLIGGETDIVGLSKLV
ncbi:hypothetical protein HZC08_01520 [Candidatus Micrarchaeota archaeon]|nr:hypothetical protein [Candidatus Micrarchaeota archaeon]